LEQILYEKLFNIKTSGNEVYNTASSLLVLFKNSCSELHYQKFFKLKGFSYKIGRARRSGADGRGARREHLKKVLDALVLKMAQAKAGF
jgi:hypothetical protein